MVDSRIELCMVPSESGRITQWVWAGEAWGTVRMLALSCERP